MGSECSQDISTFKFEFNVVPESHQQELASPKYKGPKLAKQSNIQRSLELLDSTEEQLPDRQEMLCTTESSWYLDCQVSNDNSYVSVDENESVPEETEAFKKFSTQPDIQAGPYKPGDNENTQEEIEFFQKFLNSAMTEGAYKTIDNEHFLEDRAFFQEFSNSDEMPEGPFKVDEYKVQEVVEVFQQFSNSAQMPEGPYKAIICGRSGPGKSSLQVRSCPGKVQFIDPNFTPTDIVLAEVWIDSQTKELPRTLLCRHTKDTQISIFMYDSNDLDSLTEAQACHVTYNASRRPKIAQRFIVGNTMKYSLPQITIEDAKRAIPDPEAYYAEILQTDDQWFDEVMRNLSRNN